MRTKIEDASRQIGMLPVLGWNICKLHPHKFAVSDFEVLGHKSELCDLLWFCVTREGFMQAMMDISLSNKISSIVVMPSLEKQSVFVDIGVSPDDNGTTNIDCDAIEKLAKLKSV